MKKLIFASIVGLISFNSIAQGDPLKDLACKGYMDAVEKGIKGTENPKQNVKSATWVKLADAYMDLATQCTSDSNAVMKAFDTYTKALEVEKAAGGKKVKDIEEALKSQKLGNAFLQQGAAFYNSKNMLKAGKFFAMSSAINDKDSTAALYAGIVNQGLGNNAEAINSFSKYFTNGGKDPAVFYSLAQIYKVEKRFDEAVAILKKGSEIHPKDKDLKNEIINTYLASNNIEKAIVDLEKMVEIDPKNALNISNLGLLYDSKSQDINNEIQKIKDILKKSNSDEEKAKLVLDNETKKVYEDELVNLASKIKKDPKKASEYKRRIGEVTSQKQALEDKISSRIKNIEAIEAKKELSKDQVSKLGELEAKFKVAKDKALGMYNKSLELDPNNYDVNYNLAVLYFNDAVETKKIVDAMDMKTFQAEGKAVEQKACSQFQIAKPYFDKCKSIKPDDDNVLENLKNLDRILEQCKN